MEERIKFNTTSVVEVIDRGVKFLRKIKCEEKDYRLTVAVCGTENDLSLIKAASIALGAENLLVMTADTGAVSDDKLELIGRACDIEEIEYEVISVDVFDFLDESFIKANEQNITDTPEYKRVIFTELLHNAWLRGFSVMADGCNSDNYSKNGNSAQHDMGVISPLCE